MKKHTRSTAIPTYALKAEALASMSASFERFCLAAGLETLSEMLEQDATAACGERHERGERRQAHRWGRTKGKIGFHGGKVAIERPRVRGLDGAERVLPSWENAVSEDLLGKWAMNQMLINVSTRRFKRSVRLPEGDVPASDGAGLSKSATSRRFVALSAARMRAWMETRLDDLDLLAIQIDGIHMDEDMLLVAAIGVDANGDKHPLGLVEGATENATTVQALIDNLIERGTRSNRATPVHHRWRKGAVQGDPPHLWTRCGDPALPDSQGAQHSGAVAQIDARFGAARLAASLGNGRRRKGRNPHSQSRPPSRTGLERRFCFDPGRDQRDAHRYQARPPLRTAPLARLHQHHRECHGHGAQSSAATSNTGARPRWPCDGPPPPCTKRSRASVD